MASRTPSSTKRQLQNGVPRHDDVPAFNAASSAVLSPSFRSPSASVSSPEVQRLEAQLASSVRTQAALREQARHLAEKAVAASTASAVQRRGLESEALARVESEREVIRLSQALVASNKRIAELSSPLHVAHDVVRLAKVQDAARRTRLATYQLRDTVASAASAMTAWQRDELANLAKLVKTLPKRVLIGPPGAPISSFGSPVRGGLASPGGFDSGAAASSAAGLLTSPGGLASPSAWLSVGADGFTDPEGNEQLDGRTTALLREYNRERTDLKARLAGLASDLAVEKSARAAAEARVRLLEAEARDNLVPTSVLMDMSRALMGSGADDAAIAALCGSGSGAGAVPAPGSPSQPPSSAAVVSTSKMLEELAALRSLVTQKTADLNGRATELASVTGQRDTLSAQLASRSAELAALQEALAEARQEVQRLSTGVEGAEGSPMAAGSTEGLPSSVGRATGAARLARGIGLSSTTTIEALQARHESELAALRSQYEARAASVESTAAKASDELALHLAALTDRLGQLEGERGQLQEALGDVSRALEAERGLNGGHGAGSGAGRGLSTSSYSSPAPRRPSATAGSGAGAGAGAPSLDSPSGQGFSSAAGSPVGKATGTTPLGSPAGLLGHDGASSDIGSGLLYPQPGTIVPSASAKGSRVVMPDKPAALSPLRSAPIRPASLGDGGAAAGGAAPSATAEAPADGTPATAGTTDGAEEQAVAGASAVPGSVPTVTAPAAALDTAVATAVATATNDLATQLQDTQAQLVRLNSDLALARAASIQASAAASSREVAWQQAALQHALSWQGQLVQARAEVEQLHRLVDSTKAEATEDKAGMVDKLAAARAHAKAASTAATASAGQSAKAEVEAQRLKAARAKDAQDLSRLAADVASLQGVIASKDEAIRQLKDALLPDAAREWKEEGLQAQLRDAQTVIGGLRAQLASVQEAAAARDKALSAKDGDLVNLAASIPVEVERVTHDMQRIVGTLRDQLRSAEMQVREAERTAQEQASRAERAETELSRVRKNAAHLQRLADAGHFASTGAGRSQGPTGLDLSASMRLQGGATLAASAVTVGGGMGASVASPPTLPPSLYGSPRGRGMVSPRHTMVAGLGASTAAGGLDSAAVTGISSPQPKEVGQEQQGEFFSPGSSPSQTLGSPAGAGAGRSRSVPAFTASVVRLSSPDDQDQAQDHHRSGVGLRRGFGLGGVFGSSVDRGLDSPPYAIHNDPVVRHHSIEGGRAALDAQSAIGAAGSVAGALLGINGTALQPRRVPSLTPGTARARIRARSQAPPGFVPASSRPFGPLTSSARADGSVVSAANNSSNVGHRRGSSMFDLRATGAPLPDFPSRGGLQDLEAIGGSTAIRREVAVALSVAELDASVLGPEGQGQGADGAQGSVGPSAASTPLRHAQRLAPGSTVRKTAAGGISTATRGRSTPGKVHPTPRGSGAAGQSRVCAATGLRDPEDEEDGQDGMQHGHGQEGGLSEKERLQAARATGRRDTGTTVTASTPGRGRASRPATPSRLSYRSLSSTAAAAGQVTSGYSVEAGDNVHGASRRAGRPETGFSPLRRGQLTPGRGPSDVAGKVAGTIRVPRRQAARWAVGCLMLGKLVQQAQQVDKRRALDALRLHAAQAQLSDTWASLSSLERYMESAQVPAPALSAEAQSLRERVDSLQQRLGDSKRAHAADREALAAARAETTQARLQCDSLGRVKTDLQDQLSHESAALARARAEVKKLTDVLGATEQERSSLEEDVAKLTMQIERLAEVEVAVQGAKSDISRERLEVERLTDVISQMSQERELLVAVAELLRAGERLHSQGILPAGATGNSLALSSSAAGGPRLDTLPPAARALLTGHTQPGSGESSAQAGRLPPDLAMVRDSALAVASELRAKSATIAGLEQALASCNEALAVAQAGQAAASGDNSKMRAMLESALAKARECEGLKRELEGAVQDLLSAQEAKEEAVAAKATAMEAADRAEDKAWRMELELQLAVDRSATLAAAKAGLEAELMRLQLALEAQSKAQQRAVLSPAPVLSPPVPVVVRPQASDAGSDSASNPAAPSSLAPARPLAPALASVVRRAMSSPSLRSGAGAGATPVLPGTTTAGPSSPAAAAATSEVPSPVPAPSSPAPSTLVPAAQATAAPASPEPSSPNGPAAAADATTSSSSFRESLAALRATMDQVSAGLVAHRGGSGGTSTGGGGEEARVSIGPGSMSAGDATAGVPASSTSAAGRAVPVTSGRGVTIGLGGPVPTAAAGPAATPVRAAPPPPPFASPFSVRNASALTPATVGSIGLGMGVGVGGGPGQGLTLPAYGPAAAGYGLATAPGLRPGTSVGLGASAGPLSASASAAAYDGFRPGLVPYRAAPSGTPSAAAGTGGAAAPAGPPVQLGRPGRY